MIADIFFFLKNTSMNTSFREIPMGVLEVTTDGGVQTIKFNRPEKKNAINREMYEGVMSALNQSSKDDSVVVTVLTGSGDFYSSGNDFTAMSHANMEDFFKESTNNLCTFIAMLIDYPKLLVAVVNGPALGIAATTLALCDIVYASDKAWFSTPFTRMGLVPEGCSSVTFPSLMGSKASQLLYLNEPMTSSEALACGLVTRLFPASQLAAETSALTRKYAQLPLQSLVMAKQLVRSNKEELHAANRAECQALLERFMSEDFFNAMLSFQKKKSKL